jgi:glycosyltransferase involved in cell wall biosynthesis
VIPNGFIAYLASFVTRVPYSVTIPGSDVYLGGKNPLFKSALKLACENASWVISDSNHYLKHMKSLGANPKNTSVIRYGVDTNFLKPKEVDKRLMSKLKISSKNKIILALGRFVEKKGFIYLIEAMPKIIKKFPNAKLLIVGDGELRELYQEKVDSLGLSSSVVMPGAAPFAKRNIYYNLSDVFVMPSTKDSKGNMDASPVAMMDAMCCGIPVVATKYSGDPSIVDGVDTGFIVKDKDSDEIAKAVIKILGWKDQSKRRKVIRKLAEDNFSVRAVAKKYIKIYENFI